MSSTKHKKSYFALIDCNNFFASCEQVFNPKLIGKPLVILSSNDGCVISRSKEAKALGIKMGAPLFEYRRWLEEKRIIAISSNFALYGDMSHRVMQTLETFGFPTEIYSIDEAFLTLPELSALECEELAKEVRKKVKKWTGLPVAIGIGLTKTLAKAENEIGKKAGGISVAIDPETIALHLKQLLVSDVWGIGRAGSEFLQKYQIQTAFQFRECEDGWIKKHLTVGGLRTAIELRGTACLDILPEREHSQSITASRSFGRAVTTFLELKEAVATFAGIAAKKLRDQKASASFLSVFIATSRFVPGEGYSNTASLLLPFPTSYTPDISFHAEKALKAIFKEGFAYKKAGIILSQIGSEIEEQLNLWDDGSLKKQRAIYAFDTIAHKYGRKSLFFAAEGIDKSWKSRSSSRSPLFTTSWEEIPLVKI
jgi:DNA polymerase V